MALGVREPSAWLITQGISLETAVGTADYANERGCQDIMNHLLFTRRETCLGLWFILYPVLFARFV